MTSKSVVQCDFDGTVTEDDQSFLLLDAYARGNWRQHLQAYRSGTITVGEFNAKAFSLVKEDRRILVDFAKRMAKIRPGFHELVSYCHREKIKFIIVSNGLDFYIKAILNDLGFQDIEVFAAQSRFLDTGIEVKYIGPDGDHLDRDFKEAYTKSFLRKGYHTIYVGNGMSDLSPAKHSHHVFARDELLDFCKQTKLEYIPFLDFHDVVRGLKRMKDLELF